MLRINYKTILKVALPLMAGTFIQSIVMITDASILSRYSTLSFDASGNAGLIFITLFMALSGLGDAAQIIMARRVGESKRETVNGVLQSSFLINLVLGVIFFLMVIFGIPSMLFSYSKNLDIANEQVQFLNIRSIGFFLAAFILSLNAFFMAIGKTWVILLTTLIFAISNIALDFLLVFGYWNIPAMGIEGAALASVISEGIALVMLFIFLFYSPERNDFKLFRQLEIKKVFLKHLSRVGTPLVIQGFFALATWTVFFTWIEQLGTYELTVSQNIRSIYFLAFVPIFGFAATTKTYVAQYMSENNSQKINIIIRRIQFLILLFLILFFHGALLYPNQLILMINPKEIYLEDSANILRLIFGSILLFGLSTPLFQTINGSGNTRITLIIEIISISLYMVFAFLFIKIWEWPIFKIWTVEYIYFGSLGLFSLLYLRFFNWKKKVF